MAAGDFVGYNQEPGAAPQPVVVKIGMWDARHADYHSAVHHHHELIMCVPVFIKMRARRKLRIVGNPTRDRVGALPRGLHTNGGAIASSGWAPLNVS